MNMSIALASFRSLPRARTLRRATIVSAATAAAVLLFAGPALAHITVSPDTATAGEAAVLTFHVPNEEAKADTVKVDVQIPTDHPIAQLLVQPVPGWTFTVKTITLAKPLVTDDGSFSQAVSEVIWSGGKILPGQFQSFTISADPMPTGLSQLLFKAIQTYSNGDVVRWIDLSQPGQPAPDHPAPTLTLTAANAPASTGGKAGAAGAGAAPAASGSDGMARWLAVAGLLVALLASLLALTSARRARRLIAGIGARAGTTAASDQAGAAEEHASGPVPAGAKTAGRRDQAPAGTKASAGGSQTRRRG
jgi:uncharacterized protein YcnI